MNNDPIIEEIRKVREQIAAKHDFNVHAYFKGLRQRQARLGKRLVNLKQINNNDKISPSVHQPKRISRGQ